MASSPSRPRPARTPAPSISTSVFGIEPNVPVMHQVVTAQLAARRAGTQSTKTRSEVRGGGAKPWRQKGTGRRPPGLDPCAADGVAAVSPTAPSPASTARRPPRRWSSWRSLGAVRPGCRRQRRRRRLVGASSPRRPRRHRGPRRLGLDGKVLVVLGQDDTNACKSFRNLTDVHCHRTSANSTPTTCCTATVVVVHRGDSFPPADAATSRRPPTPPEERRDEGPPRRHHRAGRLGEVLRAPRDERLHLRGRTRARRSPRSATPSSRSWTSRSSRSTRSTARASEAQPSHRPFGPSPPRSVPSSPSPRATRSICSRTDHGDPYTQAHQPRPSLPDELRLLRDHHDDAREVAARHEAQDRRSQQLRPQDQPSPRRRPQAAVPHHRLQAHQGRRAGQGRAIEYDPNRTCRIALLHYHDGEKRYILAPEDLHVGDTLESGQGAEIRPATPCRCASSRSVPRSTTSSSARWRRQDRPLGRHARPAGCQGRRLRHAASAQHRDAPGADRLSCDRRRGRQRRARTRQDRQGRPQPLEGRRPRPAVWP